MTENGATSSKPQTEGGGELTKELLERQRPEEHKEKHFLSSERVRDIILGVSDGLTVPFALAAGLSGAESTSRIILVAGLAEVVAGSISMGLGGHTVTCIGRYLAAQSEADHYMRELKREEKEIIDVPDLEAAECGEILAQYGVEAEEAEPVVRALTRNPHHWVRFMMNESIARTCVRACVWVGRFELGLEKPEETRAIQSAATIAASYAVGGLFPLLPYMVISSATHAVIASVVVTLAALLLFGYVKAYFTGDDKAPIKSALQTAFVGAMASAAAYGIARLIH
ncbi:unnamed protein product [Linum tenue]|uniref:Vacuolar iron transporter n=1 Tax=Linum tenue TaxID=586396 RepID=A0AAV0HDR4_9ROSI|nr:unnamed protein product [Linum tenue]